MGQACLCGCFSLIIWLWHHGGKGLLFYDGAQIWNGWIWGPGQIVVCVIRMGTTNR